MRFVPDLRTLVAAARRKARPRHASPRLPVVRDPCESLPYGASPDPAERFPLEGLADLTARFTLVLFALVNVALIRIKAREADPPRHIYLAPRWAPWAGLISCAALLLADVLAVVGATDR